MRTFLIIWLIHFLATVSGWYALGSVAQGVVDGTAIVPPPLVVFNEILEILLFPLVTVVLWLVPGTGGYSLQTFVSFVGAAAVNSAIVVAALTALLRRIRRRMATR
jgi:hypothetical protein